MTFPTANSTIIRNEDGEPLGFETDYGYEPDYDDADNWADDYEDDGEPFSIEDKPTCEGCLTDDKYRALAIRENGLLLCEDCNDE